MNNCFYCEKNEANNERYWYTHELFYVEKRTIPSGMKYRSERVSVPRCKNCRKIHTKIMLVTLIIGAIIFASSAFFYRTQWHSNWLTVIILSVLTSFFITAILNWIYNYFFTKSTFGIKAQEAIESFPLVDKMIYDGWVLSKPDPSLPSTAEENRELEKRLRAGTKKGDHLM